MRAMILAAGRGQRMGSLTASIPKPLLQLSGETLIGRQLRQLHRAGIRDVVVNLSYRGDQIEQALGDGSAYGLSIHYSREPEPPLETAGGIVQALPRLGPDPFLVVNADVVCDCDLSGLVLGDALGVLVMVPNPPHHTTGDYGLDAAGRLAFAAPRYTFSGISLLSPELFAGLEPGRRALGSVFDSAIAAGRLAGVLHTGLWLDVGTPERLTLAASVVGGVEP
jgi:MurNAc alpha-1-phosphate uridylyltransferase